MAACLKLGSKPDTFVKKGQAWFCTSGLPSDIVIEVQGMSFHLHKFPLVARSGKLVKLLEEQSKSKPKSKQSLDTEDADDGDGDGSGDDAEAEDAKTEEKQRLSLPDIPGGQAAFELAAKFCYGFRLELTASNVVPARCAAEYLEMNEDLGEGNLMAKTEEFLNQIVLRNWKECTRALQSCESVLPQAEDVGIVALCVDAIAMMACTDPGWPMLHSPGGSLLWNGISTGAKPKKSRSDWWYDDVAVLSLPLYRRVIIGMESRGMKPEGIAGALMQFAKKHLPGLNNRRQAGPRTESSNMGSASSESDQRMILETVESMLPSVKGVVPSKFLSGLLRSAMILNASPECKSSLERRIGSQLETASLEDLLLPNLSYNVETLYDTDCVQRIVDHFLLMDQSGGAASPQSSVYDGPLMSPSSLTPMMMVARLLDGYLAEIAPDVNLKPMKFLSLAEVLPEYSRISDDGIYRAIDIYLKAHQWLKEDEREQLCRIMDCQKLSLEACTHAAQNERLPLRVVVQVLFFEQLQLRTAIANCFMMSDTSRPLRTQSATDGPSGMLSGAVRGVDGGWSHAIHENQNLKVDMDNMRMRVRELERECSGMREQISKIGKVRGHWKMVSSIVGSKFRAQLCRVKGNAVHNHAQSGEVTQSPAQSRGSRHDRSFSMS